MSDAIDRLLDARGQTFSDELGIVLANNTPMPLFRWLTATQLFAARINAVLAVRAAQALADAGLTTAEKMAEASWQDRSKVLRENGYKHYDESAAKQLGDTAEMCLDRYQGDLRKLREEADGDPARIRERVEEFKCIGPMGSGIFCREAQLAWEELGPFADETALEAAGKLGLPTDAEGLRDRAPEGRFVDLLAALVRTDLEGDHHDWKVS